MATVKSTAANVRTALRPQLLSGRSLKDAVLTDAFLAKSWPALLDAHAALPTPGRAMAMQDARHMLGTGIARVSIARSAKEYQDRKMGDLEVAAVQSWVDNQALEDQRLSPERAETRAAEHSLAAQASHHHEEAAERLFDHGERMKLVLEQSLQPAFPEGASAAEQIAFLQDKVEEANKEKRRIRVRENLEKCTKAALAVWVDHPAMEETRAALRLSFEAYEVQKQNLKRQLEDEKIEAKAAQRAGAADAAVPEDAMPEKRARTSTEKKARAKAEPAPKRQARAKAAPRTKMTAEEQKASRKAARDAKKEAARLVTHAAWNASRKNRSAVLVAEDAGDESVAEDDGDAEDADDESVAEDDGDESVAATVVEDDRGELEKELEEALGLAPATSGVAAPEERTADPETEAPDVPPETSRVDAPAECAAAPDAWGKKGKYVDHHWSDSANDVPGTSTSGSTSNEESRNASHRHQRERRERAEDKLDQETMLCGKSPPERNRYRQSPLRSRNDRYKAQMDVHTKAQMGRKLSREMSVATSVASST